MRKAILLFLCVFILLSHTDHVHAIRVIAGEEGVIEHRSIPWGFVSTEFDEWFTEPEDRPKLPKPIFDFGQCREPFSAFFNQVDTSISHLVRLRAVHIDETTDGHSSAGFEPPVPPLSKPPSCLIRDYRGELIWPVSGSDTRDWVINNYRDLDSNGGATALQDYTGATGINAKTYDTHRGIDIDISSFREMDNNDVLILAAAPGEVETIIENNPDRNTSWPTGCGSANNRITVRHPEGFLLSYLHLKTNSVADVAELSVGDKVATGDTLGVVGSAGCSTQAHLHFQVNDCRGGVVDPFQQGLWQSPPTYNTPLGVMDAVVTSSPIPNGAQGLALMKDPPLNAKVVLPDVTMGLGVMLAGGQPGEQFDLQIIEPDGDEFVNYNLPINAVQRRSWPRWFFTPKNEPGTWTARLKVNNVTQKTVTFNVSKYANVNAFQIVKHGMSSNTYQDEVDHLVAAGFSPFRVDGYTVNDKKDRYFNAVYDKSPGAFVTRHLLTGSEYDDLVNDFVSQGYRIIHADIYAVKNNLRYTVVMKKLPGPLQTAIHGKTTKQYEDFLDDMKAQGFHPVIISADHKKNGNRRYLAVFENDPVGAWVVKSTMTANEYDTEFNTQAAGGKVLRYLNGYNKANGAQRFSAVWVSQNPWNDTVGSHGMSKTGFQDFFDDFGGQGFRVEFLSGYAKGETKTHRFASYMVD